MDSLNHLEPSISGGDDFIWISSPHEGFGACLVVFFDEAVDGGLKIDQRMKDAMFEATAGQLGEEALDRVQPGT